jgi:hypothetical protein
MSQRAAFQEAHAEVVQPFVRPDFINRDDVGMLHSRCRLGLRPKRPDHRVRVKIPLHNHLHGNDSVETHLARPVDHAHAAPRDFLQ